MSRMRIAQFLAAAGLGSRRSCERLIATREVAVNGSHIDTPALVVNPDTDTVTVDGRKVVATGKRYLLLNKPRGYTCSARDEHADHLVSELFAPAAGRLFTVGRLDRDSEGLLICTNDGDFAEQVAHPRYEVAKTYRVWVSGTVSEEALAVLRQGIVHRGDRLVAVAGRIIGRTRNHGIVELVVREGKKHEIRRMCGHCGWRVDRLLRTAIGPIADAKLKPGDWRDLTHDERSSLTNIPA